jgi:hypothetical protein
MKIIINAPPYKDNNKNTNIIISTGRKEGRKEGGREGGREGGKGVKEKTHGLFVKFTIQNNSASAKLLNFKYSASYTHVI